MFGEVGIQRRPVSRHAMARFQPRMGITERRGRAAHQPLELPMREEYGGCKSWVELATAVSTERAQPVLMEREFSAKLERFRAALEPAAVI